MQKGIIFQLNNPREVLVYIFQAKKDKNQKFSLRAWAKQLGFRNPSYLSDVLAGKVRVKPKLAFKISKTLALPEEERRYFEAMVYRDHASTDVERKFYEALLFLYRPQQESLTLVDADKKYLEQFTNWVSMFIGDVVRLKDFREDVGYLARRLGPDVTPHMVEIALNEGMKSSLLKRDEKGKLRSAERADVKLPSQTVQYFYDLFVRKIFERMNAAFITQITKKEAAANFFPMVVRKQDINEVKNVLADWVNQFRERFTATDGEGEELYILGINYFKLTLGERESSS